MLHKSAKFAFVTLFAVSAATVHAQTVKGTVALPGLPEQVAVNPIADRVYVAVPNFGAEPFDYLTVIDGKTDTVIKNIEIPPVAYAVAVDSFLGLVYVGGSYQDANGVTHNEVVVVNPAAGKVLNTISISDTPGVGVQGLAVDVLNGNLYVANGSDDEVDVIRGYKIRARIAMSGTPFGVAVNPLLNTVYASLLNGNISVISGRSNTVTATTPFGDSDAGIAVDLISGNVLTTNSVGAPSVPAMGILDKTGTLLNSVVVGNFPLGVDVDYLKHIAYVANSGDNTVSVIDEKTDTVTATLPVSALFLAVNPATKKVYVAPAANTAALTVISE